MNVERKLVKLSRGELKVVATTSDPLTWRDHLRVYYAKAIVILNMILIAGTELSPIVPHAERHWLTSTLAVVSALILLLNREKAWVERL